MITDQYLCQLAAEAYTLPPTIHIADARIRITRVDGRNVVMFAGTDPKRLYDLLSDLQQIPRLDADLGIIPNGCGWDVDCAIDQVQSALGDRPTLVGGHSKGGAEGIACGAKLRARGFNVERICAFASPRVCFPFGCKIGDYVDAKRDVIYRHGADPIPEMPFFAHHPIPLTSGGIAIEGIDTLPDHELKYYADMLAAMALRPS